MSVPTPSLPLVTPGSNVLSDSGKTKALVDNPEAHYQPVTDPSEPEVIEKVGEALRDYFLTPTSERN